MAPHGDTVRFVDDDERDLHASQTLQDLVLGELLGGEEDVVGIVFEHGPPVRLVLRLALARIDRDRLGCLRVVQTGDLIVLERDQGRDDDRHPR